MSEHTKIEWCDHSWSPWRGCTKVSDGCTHCYAETLSKRNPAVLGAWGRGKPRVMAKNWKDPVKWNRELICDACGALFAADPVTLRDRKCYACGLRTMRRRRVFPSLCDWLDDEVPIAGLADFLKLIHDTPNLDWLVLSKRPENFFPRVRLVLDKAVTLSNETEGGRIHHDRQDLEAFTDWLKMRIDGHQPANVWVGTSVEDQPNADKRLPALLKIPAALRFMSVEPMLRPVDLKLADHTHCNRTECSCARIHWVIIGGESGHGARPCNVGWIRDIVRQCKAAGVPCFVKQLGANPIDTSVSHDYSITRGFGVTNNTSYNRAIREIQKNIRDKKGGDPAEWSEDLRVREFPEVRR